MKLKINSDDDYPIKNQQSPHPYCDSDRLELSIATAPTLLPTSSVLAFARPTLGPRSPLGAQELLRLVVRERDLRAAFGGAAAASDPGGGGG